jgi:hypothetical protein
MMSSNANAAVFAGFARPHSLVQPDSLSLPSPALAVPRRCSVDRIGWVSAESMVS